MFLGNTHKISMMAKKTKGLDLTTENLQIYLDANDLNSYSGSGNTWYDLSGNGKNAVLTNTNYTTVGSANCLQITNTTNIGGTSKIYYGDVIPSTTTSTDGRGLTSGRSEFCIMMFLYSTYSSTNLYDEGYSLYWQNTIKSFRWHTRDTSTGLFGSRNNDLNYSLPLNQWVCFTANYSVSNSVKSVYFNKTLAASTSTSIDAITVERRYGGSTGASEIGAVTDAFEDRAYRGYIGNFLFYDSALTQSEIDYNFDILNASFSI